MIKYEVFWAYSNREAAGRAEFEDLDLLNKWVANQNILYPGFIAYVWVSEGDKEIGKLYKPTNRSNLNNHSNRDTKEKWLRSHIKNL